MLTRRRWLTASALGVGLALSACTSSDAAEQPPESTTTTTELPERPETIRIGIAVNDAAPTAAFDAQIESILTTAADTLTEETGINLDVRTVSIETSGQAEGTILSLINDGVSVVITGCDDATVPAVVEAATTNELLAVTGCVALPRPDVARLDEEIDGELFLDLSSLSDDARAIANYAADEAYESLGVLSSNLLPDVERTCLDLVSAIPVTDAEPGITTTAVTFTELVDAPAAVAEELVATLGDDDLDALVICALPPTAGDIVPALRSQGFDQPVIIPWYSDAQLWPEDTNNVFVVTPASRQGDDPQDRTASLFDALIAQGETPDAVDVVTADTLAILTDAAVRTGSVGSRRLADAINTRASETEADILGLSGPLQVGGDADVPVRRVYRVIAIEDGEAAYLAEASALDPGTSTE